MTNPLDPQVAEAKARELLNARITSVRTLVTARQALTDLRDQITAAERADLAAYTAALRDGWSTDELRQLGLTEPDKKTRLRRRATTQKTTPTPPATNAEAPSPAANQLIVEGGG